ncbi:hypothetical protein BD408DRAFT_419805 [Parasitella parasitica]|nr:hypothetical protein BD408DRAFT_419805 [Parasitella parasitica]
MLKTEDIKQLLPKEIARKTQVESDALEKQIYLKTIANMKSSQIHLYLHIFVPLPFPR